MIKTFFLNLAQMVNAEKPKEIGFFSAFLFLNFGRDSSLFFTSSSAL
jgi:hypothetical protein